VAECKLADLRYEFAMGPLICLAVRARRLSIRICNGTLDLSCGTSSQTCDTNFAMEPLICLVVQGAVRVVVRVAVRGAVQVGVRVAVRGAVRVAERGCNVADFATCKPRLYKRRETVVEAHYTHQRRLRCRFR